MKQVTIERATPSDFKEIADLDLVGWKQHRDSERIPDGQHVWRQWCEHSLVYVARNSEGRIVGAILAFRCIEELFCVHKVLVDVSCRGLGIGSQLFDALLAVLDKWGFDCFLTVDPVNTPAVHLYEKWGFVGSPVEKDYYGPGKDRIVMKRTAKRS